MSKEHKPPMPFDCVVAVTYRCNSRCLMCNIWNEDSGDDLDAALLAKLPDSLRYVNLSGGEPFLRSDLPELVRIIKVAAPAARIIISSNGLVKRSRETMSLIRSVDPNVGLAISVDGMGATHDRVRGVPGAFEKAVALVRDLKADGMQNLRLAFTVFDENVRDFSAVYELSRELDVEFTSAIAQGSQHYFKASGFQPVDPVELRRQFNAVATRELRTATPKRWARAYFDSGLFDFASGSGRPLQCRAAGDFFFLNPAGEVYACNVLDLPLGNLRDSSFAEVWSSPTAVAARERVAACDMGCWMICTARAAIKNNPLKVAGWVASGKLKATLRRPVL
ncbi:MAG: radical SAM protein [Thermoleophilia bacterium]